MYLGVIGAGRVGTSFILALRPYVTLTGISGSTPESSRKKAAVLGTSVEDSLTLVQKSRVILLAVQDCLIGDIAQKLAGRWNGEDWSDKVLFHCSGASPSDILFPLIRTGIHIGSLHPLQAFAEASAENLKHIHMAFDGDDTALRVAREIASLTGSVLFRVPPADRALYHAAACFCSNYAVVCAAAAEELMSRWTGDRASAKQALLPLIRGTFRNLCRTETAGDALTGPIIRGDVSTVIRHLEVLPPESADLYCALGQEAVRIAAERRTIDPARQKELMRILKDRNREELCYDQESDNGSHPGNEGEKRTHFHDHGV